MSAVVNPTTNATESEEHEHLYRRFVRPRAVWVESFQIAASLPAEPGTVMILGDDGTVRESLRAYDKRVAGIAVAADHEPLAQAPEPRGASVQQPIAILGKAVCKVDARYGTIEIGDLLTTSATAGHAMKATDGRTVLGTVIGKALGALASGVDLIPVLVALQ